METRTNTHEDTPENFENFRSIYLWGIRHIDEAKQNSIELDTPGQCQLVSKAANAAFFRLKATAYGQALVADQDLASVLTGLEEALGKQVEPLRNIAGPFWSNDHPTIVWHAAPHHKLEREFRYWGELGQILYFFREQGLSIGTDQEKALRKKLLVQCSEFSRELDEILLHPVLKVAYSQPFLKDLQSARAAISKAQQAMNKAPIDNSAPNPFQRGDPNNDTIIRRQFVMSVCHLGFELFGDMPAQLLDNLLESKSASATRLDLEPWTRLSDDTRAREIRSYLSKALSRASGASRTAHWNTEALINGQCQAKSKSRNSRRR